MGVIYDFNQQVIPTENTYDVVKVVPNGFVLYKEDTPSFAFFPGQFVGVKNGIKVNDPDSNWKLVEIDSYLLQFGNRQDVIENLPGEIKETLQKLILNAIQNNVTTQIEDINNTESSGNRNISVYKIAEILDAERIRVYSLDELDNLVMQLRDPEKIVRQLIFTIFYGLRKIVSNSFYRENVEEMSLEEFIKFLRKNALKILDEYLEYIKDSKNDLFIKELEKVKRFVEAINKFPLLEFFKQNLTPEEYKAITSLNTKKVADIFIEKVSEEEKKVFEQILDYDSIKIYSRFISYAYISSNRAAETLDLVFDSIYLNISDGVNSPESFVIDKDKGINLFYLVAETLYEETSKNSFAAVSFFDYYLLEKALSNTEFLYIERKMKQGVSTRDLFPQVLSSFIKEMERVKKLNEGFPNYIETTQVIMNFSAVMLLLSGYTRKDIEEVIKEARNYILNIENLPSNYKILNNLIRNNYLKIFFSKKLQKLVLQTKEQKEEKPAPITTQVSDNPSLKELESAFEEISSFYKNNNLINSELPNLDDFLNELTKDTYLYDITSILYIRIRNTDLPAHLVLFSAFIDPRLINSIEETNELNKYEKIKNLFKILRKLNFPRLTAEEESLYIRTISLLAKDFIEITENELNDFINSVNAYIQDTKTLVSAITILNNIFKATSIAYGGNELSFKKHQLEVLNLHDKIIESLEIEKVLRISEGDVTDNYLFNFRQQIRNLNNKGVDYLRSSPDNYKNFVEYINAFNELAKSVKNISPDFYEEILETFNQNFSLNGDYSFVFNIKSINKKLHQIIEKINDDISYGEASEEKAKLYLDTLAKISNSILLGEALIADILTPVGTQIRKYSLIPQLLEREAPGILVYISEIQNSINRLSKVLDRIIDKAEDYSFEVTKEFNDKLKISQATKNRLQTLSQLGLTPVYEHPSVEGRPYVSAKFFDSYLQDPKKLGKVFTSHGNQVLYCHLLDPNSSQISRDDVFFSLNDSHRSAWFVPFFYKRYRKELSSSGGIRKPKINLSSVDSIFEKDNPLYSAKIIELSIHNALGGTEPKDKEVRFIEVKYELGEEEIYFQIPVNIDDVFLGITEQIFNEAYLSNEVPNEFLEKVYSVIEAIYTVRQTEGYKVMKKVLSSKDFAGIFKDILQELQKTPTGKKILDKTLYRYLSLAGGYFYGKKGREERVLFDVDNKATPSETIPYLFFRPVQDLGRRASGAIFNLLDKLPEAFKKVLQIPSTIRIMYTPPTGEFGQTLGFIVDKKYLFSDRGTFTTRTAASQGRPSPMTIVVNEYTNTKLLASIIREMNDTLFDYTLFSHGGPFSVNNIFEEDGNGFLSVNEGKNFYSAYHQTKVPIATTIHEIGHAVYYELPFSDKKRMFDFYTKKYIREIDKVLQKFYDQIPSKEKEDIEYNLLNALGVSAQILLEGNNEDAFESGVRLLGVYLDRIVNTMYGELQSNEQLRQEFEQFVKDVREKYMAPYALTNFLELPSVAFDAYMYNREEFVKKFPDEYKYVILPMLEYIYRTRGIDLTFDGAWEGKSINVDFQKLIP